MTDTAAEIAPRSEEDKVLPAVVYGLYLLGFTNGLTFVIGLIVAYLHRDQAGPINESHYTFAIRSFWMAIAWSVIGFGLIGAGVLLMVVLIGFPLIALGGTIVGAVSLWFVARCILGIYYLVKGEAYPRPRSWLI